MATMKVSVLLALALALGIVPLAAGAGTIAGPPHESNAGIGKASSEDHAGYRVELGGSYDLAATQIDQAMGASAEPLPQVISPEAIVDPDPVDADFR